ncbi:MAG TPA: FG-GAP-like repeat-containing protein [Candidatus Sulfotelmatobacter sp.]|nr:FG-GAP-like repeat-containing protein [Candidatus Sulfotelmatobacter sp.]
MNFAPVVSYGAGGSAVVVKDVNGDGKLDILVANGGTAGGIGVLLGNGDGTFQSEVTYKTGGMNPYSLAVEDVNGDGKLDLVAPNSVSGPVSVLLGNGDGTFQPALLNFSAGGMSVAVGDVNGDGNLDVMVCGGSSVGVLLGNGNGTFKSAVTYNSGGTDANSIAVADVNNDGKLDLLVANEGPELGSVAVLLGKGDGTFQGAVTYSTGGETPDFVTAADVNGDGNLDLLVANYFSGGVSVLLGNGDGTFGGATVFNNGGLAISFAVGDVNGDGKVDLMVENGFFSSKIPNLAVLLGNGDGTFQSHVDFAASGAPAVGDLNGDGKLDVVVTSAVGVLINISKIPTTTTLSSSANPSNFGQTVTYTSTVTKQFGEGAPTGTVTFFDHATSTNLGSSPLTNGVATVQNSTLGPSTHSIVATYQGDTVFNTSASPALSQVVLGAGAKFSTLSVAFGNQTVATSSVPRRFALKNSGDIPLTFTSIAITGANAADFTQTNTCGSSLAGGASCTFSVIFKPSDAGSRSAAVTLFDNAPSKIQKVQLKGVGVLPVVALAPASLTFRTQIVDTTSTAQTVTLTNSGLGILNISKIAVAAPFSQTNSCGSTVSPAASCTITVTFRPTTIGPLTGSVSITDNASVSPQKVPLTGTGTAVQLTPSSVAFGNQPVGTTSLARTITLSNKSHATVNITGIAITGLNASNFTETNTCGSSVASGASCFIKVKFTPSATGKRTAAVSVTDDGGGSPQKVGLAGTGT